MRQLTGGEETGRFFQNGGFIGSALLEHLVAHRLACGSWYSETGALGGRDTVRNNKRLQLIPLLA